MNPSTESTQFRVGDVLVTKDGQHFSNAIIISEEEILTDFGNIVRMPLCDVWRHFTISEGHAEMMMYDIPFTLPSPLERIDEQIDLLTRAKEHLQYIEDNPCR